jgi:hypothetical protein
MFDWLSWRRLALAVILHGLAIGSLMPSLAAAATPDQPDADTIRKTLQQVIADENIQHDPPGPVEAPPDISWHPNIEWLRYPLYILLGLAALCLLWQAVKVAMQYSRPRGTGSADVTIEAKAIPPSEGPPADELPELDEILALARAGQFEAAVHLLLLQALRQIGRTTGFHLAPALTSREILRRPGISAEAGKELGTLVGAVEVSRFGGRPAGEALFQACLDSYRRLAHAARPAASRP